MTTQAVWVCATHNVQCMIKPGLCQAMYWQDRQPERVCHAGEFDVPLRMFFPDGSSPSFRLKIIPQAKS